MDLLHFELLYALSVASLVTLAALVLYAVYLATAEQTDAADLAKPVSADRVAPRSRHRARRGRAVTPRGGAGRPSAGTSAGPRHARAA
ncbi:MAG: hypothetical protein HOV94_41215 [Saccharothrix sp.]|nr:hypothetical protein [Saccharothrix sp.]